MHLAVSYDYGVGAKIETSTEKFCCDLGGVWKKMDRKWISSVITEYVKNALEESFRVKKG